MKYLIVFNTIISVGIVCFLIYKYWPFWVEIQRSFWCKKSYAVILWRRTSDHSSKGVYTWSFRNYHKVNKWDSEMFHSGKYREYRKINLKPKDK